MSEALSKQQELATEQTIILLRNALQREQVTIQQLQGRLRATAQLLIAEIGADGPENAESVAGRAVATIQQQAETIAAHDAIKTKLEIKIQELMSRIESLESTNRIAAMALAEKEAEIARLKRDVNIILNRGLGIDWKAEAKWAARRVGVALITKDDHQRAQRILEEA